MGLLYIMQDFTEKKAVYAFSPLSKMNKREDDILPSSSINLLFFFVIFFFVMDVANRKPNQFIFFRPTMERRQGLSPFQKGNPI